MTSELPPLQMRKRPSRWHLPIWTINLLLVLGLFLAYVSIRVSPATIWPLALFGIAYPYILIGNVGCLVWWAFFRRKRMIPSLVAIALGWGHVGEYVQFFGAEAAPEEEHGPVFKVMSYNVRLFDLYNWTHNKETHDRILAFLHQERPQVLCMQEFLNTNSDDPMNVRDTLLSRFGYKASAESYTAHSRYGQHFGIATFSTFPIIDQGSIHFPDDLNNLCLWCDMVIGRDTVRVYNAHLASLRFGSLDYRFMENIEEGTGGDSLSTAAPRIIGRLKDAFIRRAKEAELISAHVRESPYPVVYCGDMNDTPMSYCYHELCTAGLSDAFVESGRGVGHTYIGAFPSFRIDHILHDERSIAWDFRTLPEELSDHRAITCQMALLPAE